MRELSWPRAAVLALAVGFLGFSLALFWNRDQAEDESSVDVGFLQDMDYHHDQALVMSQIELVNGEDPEVLKLAREVLTTQSWQMGMMERMLNERGFTSAERPDEAMAWMDMTVPVEQMPGLLSDERMAELEAAEGSEADGLFLDMMAEHHVGGLHMAEYAAHNADDRAIRELATIMARNQAMEINEYGLIGERLGLDVDIDPVTVPELGDDGILAEPGSDNER